MARAARASHPLALLAPLALCASCALNPLASMSVEEEIEEGRKAVEALRSEVGLVQNEALTAYVTSLGTRLAAHSPRKDIQYSFYVADREEVNAFAVPGGHIFVTRGLLALADSEAELVSVLGHEIGHVAARHYASRSWRKTGGTLLAALGGIAGSFIGLSEVASLPGRGLIGGHSRDQEREADSLGQQMALAAGWDPAAMTAFLQKLERDTIIALGARPEESLLDSHPATKERIGTSKERATQLGAPAQADPGGSREAYLARIEGLTLGQDPRAGVFEKELFLHPDLDLRIRFPEDWTMLNRPAFVAAIDPPVQVRVELAGKADQDPEDLARAFAEKQRSAAGGKKSKSKDGEAGKSDKDEEPEFPNFELQKAGPRLLSGGRKAYALDADFLKKRGLARIYFVRVGESIYRVSCAMPRPLAATYMEDCDRTASSMRTLAPGDRERVRWITLQIESAQPSETLRAFGVRTQNHWTESQTAAANGLALPYQLSPGQRLKIARVRSYTAEGAAAGTPAQPPAPGTAQPPAPPQREGDVQIEVDPSSPKRP